MPKVAKAKTSSKESAAHAGIEAGLLVSDDVFTDPVHAVVYPQ
jgi:hypothetical protein